MVNSFKCTIVETFLKLFYERKFAMSYVCSETQTTHVGTMSY